MSQSYPYLTLARRLCLKYGVVLAIVDEMDKHADNPHELLYEMWGIAHRHRGRVHGDKDFDAIHEVWRGEQARRREITDATSSDYHKSFIP